jgi:hypothetical protein
MFYAISASHLTQHIPGAEPIEIYLNDHYRLKLPIGKVVYAVYFSYHGHKHRHLYKIALWLYRTRERVDISAFANWGELDDHDVGADFHEVSDIEKKKLNCVSNCMFSLHSDVEYH